MDFHVRILSRFVYFDENIWTCFLEFVKLCVFTVSLKRVFHIPVFWSDLKAWFCFGGYCWGKYVIMVCVI